MLVDNAARAERSSALSFLAAFLASATAAIIANIACEESPH